MADFPVYDPSDPSSIFLTPEERARQAALRRGVTPGFNPAAPMPGQQPQVGFPAAPTAQMAPPSAPPISGPDIPDLNQIPGAPTLEDSLTPPSYPKAPMAPPSPAGGGDIGQQYIDRLRKGPPPMPGTPGGPEVPLWRKIAANATAFGIGAAGHPTRAPGLTPELGRQVGSQIEMGNYPKVLGEWERQTQALGAADKAATSQKMEAAKIANEAAQAEMYKSHVNLYNAMAVKALQDPNVYQMNKDGSILNKQTGEVTQPAATQEQIIGQRAAQAQKYLQPGTRDFAEFVLTGKFPTGASEVKPTGDFEKVFLPAYAQGLNKTVDQLTPAETKKAFTEFTVTKEDPNARADRLAAQTERQQNVSDRRADASYRLADSDLTKLSTPVTQAQARLGRLQDTLNQGNPQADALVAPELLTVMAGGQGSGLRMNEAEIARIVGGRSVWQNLQAKIQHWRQNPDEARSITPDQDRQIRALVGVVADKLNAKQAAIVEAQKGIQASQDPAVHRKAVLAAQTRLAEIDAGETTSATPAPGGGARPPLATFEGK